MANNTSSGVLHAIVTLRDDDYLYGDVILGPVTAHTHLTALAKEGIQAAPPVGSDLDDLLDAIADGRELTDSDWNISIGTDSSCTTGCPTHRRYELRSPNGELLSEWWPENPCTPNPHWDVLSAELRQVTPDGSGSIGLLVHPALLERSRR